MTPVPSYLVQSFKAMMQSANLPESHQARVLDALKKGPRISPPQLARHCGVHVCTVWGWIAKGKLPKPRKDGYRLRTWDYSEVQNVM